MNRRVPCPEGVAPGVRVPCPEGVAPIGFLPADTSSGQGSGDFDARRLLSVADGLVSVEPVGLAEQVREYLVAGMRAVGGETG